MTGQKTQSNMSHDLVWLLITSEPGMTGPQGQHDIEYLTLTAKSLSAIKPPHTHNQKISCV